MKTALLFAENFNEYSKLLYKQLTDYINSIPNKTLLSLDYDELKEKVFEKFSSELITVEPLDTRMLKKKGQPWAKSEFETATWNSASGYVFAIRFQCSGNKSLLRYKPPSFLIGDFDYHQPNLIELGLIQIKVYCENIDKDEFDFQERKIKNFIETNLISLNSNIELTNGMLQQWFEQSYYERRKIVEQEDDFLRHIKIGIDKVTDQLFTNTPIKVRKTPKPILHKMEVHSSTVIPVVSDEFYQDIIKVFNLFYKSVEKKPSIYVSKGEEDLRDYILPILELRYEGSSITAETFNKKGKTDILITHTDNTILFVAECKMWKGPSELTKAIEQLFGYMTVRETKAALIIFVKKIVDFSEICKKIHTTIKENKSFLSTIEAQSQTSVTYRFRLPVDKGAIITLTVMAFYFE